ncbi:MAG: glycosyltransferase [Candidatus Eisenbacteria bacterium]|nr:glycosyltransferase [Candidatus Eisenbacteria bacterium]
MTAPRITAIVVNWNGIDVVGPCLETLLASDFEGLDVLVVDNASTDGSVAFIRQTFPGVRIIEAGDNRGYAAGVNAGAGVALDDGADYMFVLNNDVEVAPDCLSALVEAASGRPDAAFLGPLIYYHEMPDVVWSAGGRIGWWTGHIRHVGIRQRDRGQFAGVHDVDYVTGCAALVSAQAVRQIGLMDTDYFMYNEDTDWCVRAAKAGFAIVAVGDARMWHKVSSSSGGGLTPFKIYHRIRSTFRFFSLHGRPWHWIGIVPSTVVRALWFAFRQLFSGSGRNAAAVARGAADVIRGAPRT